MSPSGKAIDKGLKSSKSGAQNKQSGPFAASKGYKVIYNESHQNAVSGNVTIQGGPARFAQLFRGYFLKQQDVELCPLLFSYGENVTVPFIREKKVDGRIFHELVYDPDIIRALYRMHLSRKELVLKLKPFIDPVQEMLAKQNPNVLFLNGFSVTNWILMSAAHNLNIPITIQHAGIWKKEIERGRSVFSKEIRSTLYDMERDTVRWASMHIFLNEFSRNTFINLYKASWKKSPAVIIPLPITVPNGELKKGMIDADNLKIGVVARWDSIKNHSAVLRLASARSKPTSWTVHSVTKIPGKVGEFAKRYMDKVVMHEPMSPADLTLFYRSMDIVFLPSHFDVSPTVVAESFLAGIPIVISDHVGWQTEFKSHDLKDHIVSTRASGAAIVKAIKEVISKQDKHNKSYSRMRAYIKDKHEPVKVFKQYESVFKTIIKSAK